MKQRLRALLIFTAFALLSTLHYSHAAGGLPEQFSATYTLSKGPLTLAEMTRKLYPKGNGSYIYESRSKAVGYARWFTKSTLLEQSEWVHDKQQLRPLTYSYDRTGDSDKERHVKLVFDWENNRVTNIINNDPWKMEIPAGTLDKLLYQLALMNDLQLGRKRLEYNVADGGTVKKFKFEIVGEERVKTSIGEFDTLKLKTEGTRTTILWCAKALNYLPVLIEQHDERGQGLLTLTSLSGIAIPTPPPAKKQ
jgi:hypothetical protein